MSPGRLRARLADRNSIERELGEGGLAIGHLVQDLKHERDVAVVLAWRRDSIADQPP